MLYDGGGWSSRAAEPFNLSVITDAPSLVNP